MPTHDTPVALGRPNKVAREEAMANRIREILASWPTTTEQQRAQAVAILATPGRSAVAQRLTA